MVVKNIAELERELKKRISEALKDDVYKTVVEAQQKRIQEDVYDSYEPSVYKRRKHDGGLIDSDNIVYEMSDGGKRGVSMSILNTTPPNESVYTTPYDMSNKTILSYWIEEGLVPNVFNSYAYAWMFPRPFVSNTIDDLFTSKDHIKALKKGLAKRGIKSS